MTTHRSRIVPARWTTARRAVAHPGPGRRGGPRRHPFARRAATAAPRRWRAVARRRGAVDRDRQHVRSRVGRRRAGDTSPMRLTPMPDRLDRPVTVRLRSRRCHTRRERRLSTRQARRVEAAAAVDAQNAPTAACKTRGRVSHSSHDASSFSCTRSTRRDYNRARIQGGIHATDSTTVATLRRVITITGLGVHDAPESPFKLTGMRNMCHLRSMSRGELVDQTAAELTHLKWT